MSEHPCPSCGDVFTVPVWHCPDCAHHYSALDDECGNCHRPRVAA